MAQHTISSADGQDKPAGASTVLNGRYMPPPADDDGQRWMRTSAIILRSRDELYNLWRDVESSVQWRGQTVEVRKTGPKTFHWVMKNGDKTIEWDSEILADEPGERIAWRSIGGDLEEAGEVMFEDAIGGRGTMVTLLQQYRLSVLENLTQTIRGRNPKQGVIESLRHFKAFCETGEIPRIEGQPHGHRGAVASMKRSTYGETIPTPEGERRRAS